MVELRLKREAAEAGQAVGGGEARGGEDEVTERFSNAGPAVKRPAVVVVDVAEAVVGVVIYVGRVGRRGAEEVGCAVGRTGGEGDGEALQAGEGGRGGGGGGGIFVR